MTNHSNMINKKDANAPSGHGAMANHGVASSTSRDHDCDAQSLCGIINMRVGAVLRSLKEVIEQSTCLRHIVSACCCCCCWKRTRLCEECLIRGEECLKTDGEGDMAPNTTDPNKILNQLRADKFSRLNAHHCVMDGFWLDLLLMKVVHSCIYY